MEIPYFGVVVVTYNRLEKLKNALMCYEEQSLRPGYVIVVNNASTDGTGEFLEEWQSKGQSPVDAGRAAGADHGQTENIDAAGDETGNFRRIVINTGSNLGGSGGFAVGLRRAIEERARWVWIADDDAYPERDCFEKVRKYADARDAELKNLIKGEGKAEVSGNGAAGGEKCRAEVRIREKVLKNRVSAVCGEVLNPDGSIDVYHRRRFTRKALVVREERIPVEVYESGEPFDVDLYSFVGTAVRWQALRKVGANNPDYFIWYDDSEHSLRVRETGRIVCLPDVRVHHDTAAAPVKTGLSWKDYYGVRNELDAYRKHLSWFDYLGLVAADYLYLWLKVKDPVSRRIMRDGIRDGRSGKLGKNQKYLPGKKIS